MSDWWNQDLNDSSWPNDDTIQSTLNAIQSNNYMSLLHINYMLNLQTRNNLNANDGNGFNSREILKNLKDSQNLISPEKSHDLPNISYEWMRDGSFIYFLFMQYYCCCQQNQKDFVEENWAKIVNSKDLKIIKKLAHEHTEEYNNAKCTILEELSAIKENSYIMFESKPK